MTDQSFRLDPRLEAASHFVADLPLSQLRLHDDARYPWLVLIPRQADRVEIDDLAPADRHALLDEMMMVSGLLRDLVTKDPAGLWPGPLKKLNHGALGNMVSQLHVHVLGRFEGDPAWPGPVWGHSAGAPYRDGGKNRVLSHLRNGLGSPLLGPKGPFD